MLRNQLLKLIVSLYYLKGSPYESGVLLHVINEIDSMNPQQSTPLKTSDRYQI